MKKMLIGLLVLMIAVPAMAAVEVYVVDNGGGNVAIKYQNGESGSARPRAFGLEITVDAGTMSNFVAAKTGESTGGSKGYGIFPGSILIDAAGNVTDWGSPLASGNGTATAIIELGSLYTGGNAPDASGDLLTFDVSANCCVTLAENSARGGVIKENGSPANPDLTGTCVTIGCATCVGDLDGDNNVNIDLDLSQMVNLLRAFSDQEYQCDIGTEGCTNYCADMDSDNNVNIDLDLSQMVNALRAASDAEYQYDCPS